MTCGPSANPAWNRFSGTPYRTSQANEHRSIFMMALALLYLSMGVISS